jgi:hypothetical protein
VLLFHRSIRSIDRSDCGIWDCVAAHLGLRPLNPWLDVFLDFDEGANYAIPGATILTHFMPLGLPQQLQWHLDLVAEVLNRTTTTTTANHPSPAVASTTSPSSSSANSAARESDSQDHHEISTLRLSTESAIVRHSEALRQQRKRLPSPNALRDALYVLQIGGLDYKMSYIDEGLPVDYVNASLVPQVVAGLRDALEVCNDGIESNRIECLAYTYIQHTLVLPTNTCSIQYLGNNDEDHEKIRTPNAYI